MPFPLAPSRRMPYDTDGSLVTLTADNEATGLMSAANVTNLNDEGGGNINLAPINANQLGWVGFLFPELREFDGMFVAKESTGDGGFSIVETSVNTTNTIDGTWVQQTADIVDGTIVTPAYRTVVSFSVFGVRAVRLRKSSNAGTDDDFIQAVHLYGEIAASETPDRLLWIDNDDDLEFSLPQDYGDVPRGSASLHTVYLHNNSASLAANSVQVTAEALVGASGGWYTFDDGTGFSATKALASSISIAANSPDIIIKRIIPDDEVTGLHAARAFVSVGSWT